MTTPFLRTRALVLTKEFLQRLSASGPADFVPLAISAEADAMLRHYPTLADIEAVHKQSPDIFGPVPPFDRHIPNSEILGIIDATRDYGPHPGVHYPSLREEDL